MSFPSFFHKGSSRSLWNQCLSTDFGSRTCGLPIGFMCRESAFVPEAHCLWWLPCRVVLVGDSNMETCFDLSSLPCSIDTFWLISFAGVHCSRLQLKTGFVYWRTGTSRISLLFEVDCCWFSITLSFGFGLLQLGSANYFMSPFSIGFATFPGFGVELFCSLAGVKDQSVCLIGGRCLGMEVLLVFCINDLAWVGFAFFPLLPSFSLVISTEVKSFIVSLEDRLRKGWRSLLKLGGCHPCSASTLVIGICFTLLNSFCIFASLLLDYYFDFIALSFLFTID